MKKHDLQNLLDASQSWAGVITGDDLKSPVSFSEVRQPQEATSNSLVFVSTKDQWIQASQKGAAILIAHKDLKDLEMSEPTKSRIFWATNIPRAMSALLPLFEDRTPNITSKIHPTAVVSKSAQIGKNVEIGPYSVIGDHVEIGDQAVIGSHVVIEASAKVGSETRLQSFVFVGERCMIGNACEIHPHTTIGGNGFGFAPDDRGILRRIPQIGIVVIEDFVRIGSNCAIDRATFTETKIGEGAKLDNLCHIAHNCVIGKHCAIAGGFGTAGSTVIGDHCFFGGHVAVADHVTICSKVTVAGKSGVTNDITEPGAYVGFPAEPIREGLKTLSSLKHLPELRKQVSKIMKHLGLEKGS